MVLAEEEKDTDDWDVDMSVYYEADSGDKDARDMLTMRRETRSQSGRPFLHDDDKIFELGIGKFERHSKVWHFFSSQILSQCCGASLLLSVF